MYQLGEKMAKGVDNVLATFKSYEPAGNGTLVAKQAGGPGKVTEWVNKHHTESSKVIDDKIKNVEGSLAERILNNLGLNEESAAWFSNAVKNEKIQQSEWTREIM
ncbi:hypothetical protein COE51_11570 [Bacillus pseudomycoides]|nr:hypothetical protein COE51_11570 [Bacillus pseudomycoides]